MLKNNQIYGDQLILSYVQNQNKLKELVNELMTINIKDVNNLKLILEKNTIHFKYRDTINTESFHINDENNIYSILYMDSDIYPKYDINQSTELYDKLLDLKNGLITTKNNGFLIVIKDYLLSFLRKEYYRNYLNHNLLYLHYFDLNENETYIMMYNFIKNINSVPLLNDKAVENDVVKYYYHYFKTISAIDFLGKVHHKKYLEFDIKYSNYANLIYSYNQFINKNQIK